MHVMYNNDSCYPILCSCVTVGDDGNDTSVDRRRKFTLDDVFNDTFNPKLFSAQLIGGMSVQ